MWGIAGKSAGPPKWAGKKSYRRPLLPAIVADLAPRIRFYLHKEFRAAGIRFLSTQRIGGGDLEENGDFRGVKTAAPCIKIYYHDIIFHEFFFRNS